MKQLPAATLASTLPIQIANQIGSAIVEEQFAPGQRIRETELAQMFNVSRATIRDALRILENRGLIRIQPQRGAQVTFLSAAELENLFDIRMVLLALAAKRAAERYQETDRRSLQTALSQLRQEVDRPAAYARASSVMVSEIARLSKNEQLMEMIESFAQRIGRYVRHGLSSPKRCKQSLRTWKTLLKAIEENNEGEAERIQRRLAIENKEAAMVHIKLDTSILGDNKQ